MPNVEGPPPAAVKGRAVPKLNYVLKWDDGRCVRIDPETKEPNVSGFEHASFFGDREAAAVWLKKGLTDGKGEVPHIALAFNAQQHAVAILEEHIARFAAGA